MNLKRGWRAVWALSVPYMLATKVNSEILQLEDKIGTLEPGKYADIAAWKRDLMTDPYALLDCAFVMKEGVIYPTEKCEELTD